jgi:hypothetical protein
MRTWVAMLPVLMAGCTTMTDRPAPPRGPCVVDEGLRMRFVGVKFHERMRADLERQAQAATSRVLNPGDAATMDMRPDRLNILLDDLKQIEGLRCG